MKTNHILLMTLLLAGIAMQSVADPLPVPSFENDASWSRRDALTDFDLDMFHRSWKDSPIITGHGGFTEQAILEPGDPLDPPRCGATLICLTELNHGYLEPGDTTEPVTDRRHQTLFHVLSGTGRVMTGTETVDLARGTSVFLPAGMSYRFTSTGSAPLEVLLFSEAVSDTFISSNKLMTGTYLTSIPGGGQSWHWSHISRGTISPPWENPISFGIITIDAFEIAQPHVAPIGIEEVWLQLEGRSLMYFGNRLFHHNPGEAFYIPPNYKVPHCSINISDEPMLWMYIGIRLDRNIPITPAMQALIDSLTVGE